MTDTWIIKYTSTFCVRQFILVNLTGLLHLYLIYLCCWHSVGWLSSSISGSSSGHLESKSATQSYVDLSYIESLNAPYHRQTFTFSCRISFLCLIEFFWNIFDYLRTFRCVLPQNATHIFSRCINWKTQHGLITLEIQKYRWTC